MTRLALALLVLGTAPLAAGTIPEGGALRLSGSALSGLGVGLALPGDKPVLLPVAARPQPPAVSRRARALL